MSETQEHFHESGELSDVERGFQEVGMKVKEAFTPLGLTVTGLQYYFPKRFQLEKKGLCLKFEAQTHNPLLYGPTYDNAVRTDLQGKVFGIALADLQKLLPDIHHICLDLYPRLVPPFKDHAHVCRIDQEVWKNRLVDVFKQDEDIFLDDVAELRKAGRIEEGSDFDVLTTKYGLTHVMRHGPFIHISPDTLSVEALEALLDQREIKSILEIGCGVGTCGIAASRRGVKDFTCVEVNPKACAHLKKVLPDSNVMQQSAFDFTFDRKYDLVLIGIPYELNPWLLQKKGDDLADHADTVVFQSGMACMYDQEHDWIMGKGREDRAYWPWWKASQELANYFPHTAETSLDWQLGAIASHRNLDTTLALMEPRGFKKAEYRYVGVEN